MPIPAGVIRINVNASLTGGEQMVHTFHLVAGAGANQPGGDELAQVVADSFRNVWRDCFGPNGIPENPMGMMTEDTRYTSVAAYVLDTNARAIAQGVSALDPTVLKGASNSALPNEVAMCVSLATSRAGRTGKGRVYMGGIARENLTNDGRWTRLSCERMSGAVATVFERLNNTLEPPRWRAVVLSRTAAVASPVVSVRTGDVPDVQRRRRNRLVETYFANPVDLTA